MLSECDGPVGAGWNADVTAVTQVGVNERRFVRIDLEDGLAAAYAASQAFATCMAEIIHHLGYILGLRLGEIQREHGLSTG